MADLNAFVVIDEETGDDFTVWFALGQLHFRWVMDGEARHWVLSSEHADALCEALEELRQRSKRRMQEAE